MDSGFRDLRNTQYYQFEGVGLLHDRDINLYHIEVVVTNAGVVFGK